MVVAEKSGDVERVAKATEGESQADTEPVGDGSSKETNDREGGVEGGVGIIGWLLINLSSTTWLKLAFWICYRSLEYSLPRPFTALNMPGHMKQTIETIASWNFGLANHGMLLPKIVGDL